MKKFNMHVVSTYSADIPIWAESYDEAKEQANYKLNELDPSDMEWFDDEYDLDEDEFEPAEFIQAHLSDKDLTPMQFANMRCTDHFMGQVLTFPDDERHIGMFWYQNDEGKFTVCDNTIGEPFVEEFDTLAEVVAFFDGNMAEDIWNNEEIFMEAYRIFAKEVEIWLEENEVVV